MSLINTKFIKWTAAGVLAAGALGLASTASAGVGVSVGVALPGVAIGVVNPAPVYYAPPPPVYYRPAPVYYAPPPPVYYRPAPRVYGPGPYYGQPVHGRGYYRGHGHGHGHDRDGYYRR